MTAIEEVATRAGSGAGVEAGAEGRGIRFWIHRYLPAEIVGTAAMMFAGFAVTAWTDAPAIVAVAALIGEIVGFYAVLAVTIHLEQITAIRSRVGVQRRARRRALGRTLLLLLAEFGPAELLDTLLIRPSALLLGVWILPEAFWGLLAGKIAADVIFYAIAAGAFTLTAKTGLRDIDAERVP